MKQGIYLAFLILINSVSSQAGTVTFVDQIGSSFRFINMREDGDSLPPSRLQDPTLITAPRDTIKFSPSAFVAVTNGANVTVTQTLSTQLSVTLQALDPLFGLNGLEVSVAGTWDETIFPMTGANADAALTLQLDLIAGSITKNLGMLVNQNLVTKTWAGSLTITQEYLNSNFAAPASGLSELTIRTTQTVSASAAYGSASSAITYLDISAVPEPSSGSLLLAGTAILGLLRRRQPRAR